MSEEFSVEGSAVFFLVENTRSVIQTATFIERRGLSFQVHTDIKEFLLSCAEHRPQFLAISVNHHNPKVFELIEALGSQLSTEVIVFAENPDRRSIPLIRRAQKAHKLMGAMSGPSLMLQIRKIMRNESDVSSASSKIAGDIDPAAFESSPNFIISEGRPQQDNTYMSDVRGRGDGPAFFKGAKREQDAVIFQEGRGLAPSAYLESDPSTNQKGAGSSVLSDSDANNTQHGKGSSSFLSSKQAPKKRDRGSGPSILSDSESTKNRTDKGPAPFLGSKPNSKNTRGSGPSTLSDIESSKSHNDKGPAPFLGSKPTKKSKPELGASDLSEEGNLTSSDVKNNRGPGPSVLADSTSKKNELLTPLQVEVEDVIYKQVAQWIEDSVKYTVQPDPKAPLPFPPNTTKLAIVQVKDAKEAGYIVIASSQEDELKQNFLDRLHQNLKKLKSPPAGPQWQSFRVLDVDVADVQRWLGELTQARVLSQHKSMELIASFLASKEIIPQLKEAFKGHYALSPSSLKPNWTIDYDTYLHLKLNDKLLQYVARGGNFSKEQIDRLLSLEGSPLLIKDKDIGLFEAQFLRENILKLFPTNQKKKAA